ncbi:MAG: amidase family protein [Nitriliruptoraceae bacterium]
MTVVLVPALDSLPSARRLVAAHCSGDTTVMETAHVVLDRIAQVESEIHTLVHVDGEAVLRRAHQLDAVPPDRRGPLHGVPVGVKGVVDSAEMQPSYGSPTHAGHLPDRDAEVVDRPRAAGPLIVGKTVASEFALFTPGPTRRPGVVARSPRPLPLGLQLVGPVGADDAVLVAAGHLMQLLAA